MYKRTLVISVIVLLIIAAIIVGIVIAIDDDTGDFEIRYIGNAKKYESSIKQGVNRWSSIGTGGISLIFRTGTLSSSVIASTSGNTITLNESVFSSQSNNIKVLTIAHEVGHALGIGTWNTSADILTHSDGQKYLSNTKYPDTAKAYVDKVRPSGKTIPGAPVETDTTTSGSYLVHWEDNSAYGMQKDLMTYRISSSATVISIVDLTFLDEIGRKVDLSQAQSLKGFFSAVIAEYVFEEEESPYLCGTCHNCHEH